VYYLKIFKIFKPRLFCGKALFVFENVAEAKILNRIRNVSEMSPGTQKVRPVLRRVN
jgi:hypothetical protein